MKKITLLLLMILVSITGYSQLALEGFQSGTLAPDPLPSTDWTLGTGTWKVFDNGVGTVNRWGTNAAQVCSSTLTGYMRNENIGAGNTAEDYLSSPTFTVPANGELHFKTRSFTAGIQGGTTYQIKIAIASNDQLDPNSYILVQQWTEANLTAVFNVCEEKVVDLSAYAGFDVHIAFVMVLTQPTGSITGDRWLIDDISVDSKCLPPTGLTFSGLTQDGASLNWANPSGATSWEIWVVPAASGAPTGPGTIYNGTLPYVVTGLLPNTAYKYYVRAICSPSGFPSELAGPSSNFTTLIAPPVCGGNYVDTGGTTANYGNNENNTITICPVTPGDKVTITFTAFNTEFGADILSIYDGDSTTATLLGSFSGATLPPTFSSSAVSGCLTFKFVSNATTVAAGWAANVSCAPPPPCQQPVALTTTALLSTSVSFGWTSPGNATSWQVLALPCGSPAPTAATVGWTATTSNPYSFTTLTPNTCYDLYVRGDCSSSSNGVSLWSGPKTITTQIAPPVCGGNYVDSGGTTANYGNNENITTTICPVTLGDVVTVTFTAFNTQAGSDILTVYNGNDITGTVIATYSGTTIPPAITSSAVNGCLTFVFTSNATTTSTGWAANITCGPPPACPQPIGLNTTALLSTSVSLGWTSPGPATSWQVLALPCGSPVPTATNPAWITATSNPYSFTGLNPNTCYDLYVISDCSSTVGPDGPPSGPITVTTTTAPPVCGGNFVDEAGPTTNYADSSDSTVTICPIVPTDQVTVTFTAFNTETNWDGLLVYNGNSITAPQISSANGTGNGFFATVPGAYWGTTIPGPFTGTSPDGCLTFRFVSDTFINNPGWIANVTCAPPPTCQQPITLVTSTLTSNSVTLGWTNVGAATSWQVLALPCADPAPTATTTGWTATATNSFTFTGLSSATCYKLYVRGDCSSSSNGVSLWSASNSVTTQVAPPVCGGNYVDPGGPTVNYADSTDSTVTICPVVPTDLVTVTFTSFNTETNWDGMLVYDGNSITAPQISSTNGTGNGFFTTVPGAYWGTAIPGPFTSSSIDGCLTFRFVSDTTINNPGWIANVTCAPPPSCRKPSVPTNSAVTLDSATFSWTQLQNPDLSTATNWEVLVLPAGSPAPIATSTGWIATTTNPFVYTGLTPATCYDYYVRAVCSGTDSSLWAGPSTFCTLIPNDECSSATIALTNPNQSCAITSNGSLIGATASTQVNTCAAGNAIDVWFQFVATAQNHSIDLTNVVGNAFNLNYALYSGDCNALTQVACVLNTTGTANGLTIGQTYYIRVFLDTFATNQNITFSLCIGTIPPPIYTNNNVYTTQQLVEDVLFNSSCATVTNITTSTGTNFGSVNGIGYFNRNGSSFPFEDGVVLTSGSIVNAQGPNTSASSDGIDAWTGDADLEAIILAATGNAMNSRNASKLEFDFVPLVDTISFDFIFASEEYGNFQCTFSDAFAFLLTNVATGVTTNLAVVPNTTTPISVVTIRDNAFNNACLSVNPQYFADFYGVGGLSPLADPINFNGNTVPMTATSTVIPGQQYHIKLVVADRQDNILDSAVFLEGGSFNFGLELGIDFLISGGNALCFGTVNQLVSDLDPALYTFVWSNQDGIIAGENGPSLFISETGTYTLVATLIGTSCNATDSIVVEYYDQIVLTTPNNLTVCNNTGFGQFTLSQNNASVLGTYPAAQHTVTYHLTQSDAIAGINPLPNLYTNVVAFSQTIYARVTNVAGCFGITQFNLNVQDLTPTFTISPNFSVCSGTSGTITVTPINYIDANVSYSWTYNSNPFPGTTNQISVSQAGTYTVTVNQSGCIATGQTTLSLDTPTVPSFTLPTLICLNDTAPILPPISNNGINGTWNPSIVSNTISGNYTFTPNSGICASPLTITINVNSLVIPTFFAPAPICNGATSPTLPLTSLNGISGTWSPSVVDNTQSLTYTFTPNPNQCAGTTTMLVTVLQDCSFNSFASAVWLTNCAQSNFFNTVGSSTSIIGPVQNVFPSTYMGTYLQNSNTFILRGAEIKTFKTNSANVCSARLNYRVYPQAGTPGPFTVLDLPFIENCTGGSFPSGGPCVDGDQKWRKVLSDAESPLNLTTYPAGNYVIEVYYDLTGDVNSTTQCDDTVLINNGGNNFIASYSILENPTFTYTNPSVCNVPDGTITISGLTPNTTYSLSCTFNNVPVGPNTIISNATGDYIITGLLAGTYANFSLVVNSCTINLTDVVVLDNPILIPTFDPIGPYCIGQAVPALPLTSLNGITGTWNPPTIDNTQTLTYQFIADPNQCAINGSLTVTINQPVQVPTFSVATNINACQGFSPDVLIPTTSNEGFTGIWNPSTINYSILGPTIYTFTPDVGQCCLNAIITVVVDPNITPTFNAVGPICNGDVLNPLPTTSIEGISGTWFPSLDNTQTLTYTFTPDTGLCATTTTLTIVVNQPTPSTFGTIPAICSGDAVPTLPATSIEGFTGTWSPAVSNTQTLTYTFTPTAGQCASTGTITLTVNQPVTATFGTLPAICSGDPVPTLPATSIEGFTGTWSPAVSNTQTLTYTFTPTAGQCASAGTITLTVNQPVTATFNPIGDLCSGQISIPNLPATSIEGFTGTWLPATINNTTSGNYVFTPDANQCAATGNLSVTVIQNSFDFDIVGGCIGNNFTLEVVAVGGSFDVATANFNWENSNNQSVGNDSNTFNVTEYLASTTVVEELPIVFSVTVTTPDGCSRKEPITLDSVSCTIQKGISPNNDTLNDCFDLEGFNAKKVSIFNRYGMKVYSKNNYTNQWCGQSDNGDELPDGTYYYVIEIANGGTKTGWIYINREK